MLIVILPNNLWDIRSCTPAALTAELVERRGPIETKMTAMCCLLSVFRPTRAWSNSLSASTGVIKAEIANGRTGGPIKQIQHPNKLMIDNIQHKCSYCIFIIFVVSNTFLCGAFASNNICNRCNVRNKTENWHNLDTSKNTQAETGLGKLLPRQAYNQITTNKMPSSRTQNILSFPIHFTLAFCQKENVFFFEWNFIELLFRDWAEWI